MEWDAKQIASGEVAWDVLDSSGRPLANGVYWSEFRIENDGRIEEHKIKLLVLR